MEEFHLLKIMYRLQNEVSISLPKDDVYNINKSVSEITERCKCSKNVRKVKNDFDVFKSIFNPRRFLTQPWITNQNNEEGFPI